MRNVRIGVLVIAVLPIAAAAATAAPDDPAVTFTKHVAPILYKSCAECHRPTMFAPMSLMTYDDARPYARAIKQKVVARQMPPWGADPAFGVFKNDPRLSEKEIETIVSWVDNGAPKGDEKDMPAPPQFAEGWTISKPDAVFTMTEDFEIPATGTIPY